MAGPACMCAPQQTQPACAGARVTVVAPGELGRDTCSYSALLPLSNDSALLAYSDYNARDMEGRLRKAICARTVTVTR